MNPIKVKRFMMGLTQYDLCFETGISQPRISLIERGYVAPKELEKKKLAEALSCEIGEIFPREGRGKNRK